MRTYEERTTEAKRRIAVRERAKRLRRGKMAVISSAAASLVMPGITARIQTGDGSGFATAASIFHNSAALGYIIIGLLAFLLGVCVTVLCFRLRQMNKADTKDPESEDRHGAD